MYIYRRSRFPTIFMYNHTTGLSWNFMFYTYGLELDHINRSKFSISHLFLNETANDKIFLWFCYYFIYVFFVPLFHLQNSLSFVHSSAQNRLFRFFFLFCSPIFVIIQCYLSVFYSFFCYFSLSMSVFPSTRHINDEHFEWNEQKKEQIKREALRKIKYTTKNKIELKNS